MNTFYTNNRRAVNVLFFFSLLIFYYLSFPANRSENDDGYFYAYAIRTYDYKELLYPRYLLFMPLLKFLFSTLASVFPSIDAYLFMCVASAIATAISLLLLKHMLVEHFIQSHFVGFATTITIAISYGIWRYAAEAEVYAVAILLCLLGLHYTCMLVTKSITWKYIILAAIFGALSIIWYKPTSLIVCVVFPWYMLLNRIGWKQILLYGSILSTIVVVAYSAAYHYSASATSFIGFITSGIENSAGHPLNALPVILSNIVSLNFIYSFSAIVTLIERWFPGKQVIEETYAAQGLELMSVVAFISFTLIVLVVLYGFIKTRRQIALHTLWKHPFFLWVVIYSTALIIADPGSPEPWIMVMPALISVLWIYFFAPIVISLGRKFAYVFIGLLLLHNFIGGYWFIRSAAQDYTRYQTAWLLTHAQPKDMVISLGSASTIRYFVYYGRAKIFTAEQQFEHAMLAAKQVHANGGKVYLTEDFVHPSATVHFRSPSVYIKVNEMLKAQQSKIIEVHRQKQQAAAVYEWLP